MSKKEKVIVSYRKNPIDDTINYYRVDVVKDGLKRWVGTYNLIDIEKLGKVLKDFDVMDFIFEK